LEFEIGGAIDGSHAAAAEFAVEAVAIAEDGAECWDARAQIFREKLGLLGIEHV